MVVTKFPISQSSSFLVGTVFKTGFILDLKGDLIIGNLGVVLGGDIVKSNFITTF